MLIRRTSGLNHSSGVLSFKHCVVLLVICQFQILSAKETNTNNQTEDYSEIVGGMEAETGSYPWMAALVVASSNPDVQWSQRQFCGGTLIDPSWILTAAHCLETATPDSMHVILGTTDLDSDDAIVMDVAQIVLHPFYESAFLAHDIALIKLTTPSSLTTLPIFNDSTSAAFAGADAQVLGWGQTDPIAVEGECDVVFEDSTIDKDGFDCKVLNFDRVELASQATLLTASMEILSDNDCGVKFVELLRFLGRDVDDAEEIDDQQLSSQICAYDPEGTAGACFGDSGGPLVTAVQRQLYQVGVVSFGAGEAGCSGELSIDVFARSSFYLDFIDEVMSRNFEITFDKFCPPQLNLDVATVSLANGNSEVTLSWDETPDADSYILRYSTIENPGLTVDSINLEASVTSVQAQFSPQQRFYVSVQAKSESCTGPGSALVNIGGAS